MTFCRDPRNQPLEGEICTVFGGGGFIGAAVVRQLLDAGARVKAFGRGEPPVGLDPRAVWVRGAFADAVAVRAAMHGSALVVHLISGSNPASADADPAADAASHVVTGLAMLDGAAAEGVRRILFASSGGTVYGVTGGAPIPEEAPTDPISAYGVAKLALEKYLEVYRRRHGLDYRVLRIANAYGPGQSPRRGQGIVAAMLDRAMRRIPIEIWGDGSVMRDFIYVEDVAAAFVTAAVHAGPSRIFNIGSGEGRSIASVAGDIGRLEELGAVECAFRAGRAADVPVNVLDIARAHQELGWAPRTGWMDGLAGTLRWLRGS